MHSDQFKPKTYFKLNKKYVFSEGEQFPLMIAEAGIFLVINASRLGQGASYQITAKLVKKNYRTRNTLRETLYIKQTEKQGKIMSVFMDVVGGNTAPSAFSFNYSGWAKWVFCSPFGFSGWASAHPAHPIPQPLNVVLLSYWALLGFDSDGFTGQKAEWKNWRWYPRKTLMIIYACLVSIQSAFHNLAEMAQIQRPLDIAERKKKTRSLRNWYEAPKPIHACSSGPSVKASGSKWMVQLFINDLIFNIT